MAGSSPKIPCGNRGQVNGFFSATKFSNTTFFKMCMTERNFVIYI